MRHYESGTGNVTERLAVELEPDEAAAIHDVAQSLFATGDDPLARAMRRIAKAWAAEEGTEA